MVAFDTGHNFRKDLCDTYKDGRIETPNDLKIQFPEAKKICTLLGIKYIECDNYEADDIIGTFARMADEDKNYNATIISSDKDLLQLISDEVDVKLLKQKDYILMNEQTFFEHYGIKPIRMIDLKALMGDPSDNIPGVKGIGEKTALSLLVKYDTLDNLYNHLDELTPKTKEKLLNDKESAFFSYKLATIYRTIDFDYTFESIKYNKPDITGLIEKYKELEFNSFLKNLSVNNEENNNETPYEIVKTKINIEGIKSLYIELDDTNYHKANFIGASIYDGKKAYYFDLPSLLLNSDLLKNITATFDNKKNIVFLNRFNIDINDPFDIFIAAYLLEYNVKDDIAYLSAAFNKNIAFYDQIVSKKNILTPEAIRNSIVCKAKFIYETYQEFKDKLVTEELDNLYIDIEGPLIRILANMEINGISVKTDVIDKLKNELNEKIVLLENKIHEEAGMDFNIGSHKQMGDVLYNKLMLPKGKGKNAMSTSHEVLIKLRHLNPIIDDILDYRALTKLVSTYLETFNSYVMEDGKIHTIYKQTGTRTGRLSSVEPNLQNIPVRSEEGKQIRKAFIPSENSYLLSSDYSQIELRVLAHISNSRSLKNAFINGEDIHTHVASDIFDVPENEVTKNMRRTAKAVIFGIVYGISGYGLGENLDISPNEAKKYIEKYLTLYPEVNEYMTEIVKKAKETSSVRTLLNRKRTIDELNNTNYMIRQMGERIALNTPIQGTAADILKLAMIRIDEKLKEDNLKTKMLLQVHDELIFDVPDDELNIVIDIVREIMENVYKLSVPLKVEIDYGRDWYEAK